MIRTLIELLRQPLATRPEMFPDLPDYSRGLPQLTAEKCAASSGCSACVDACPTEAIEAQLSDSGDRVTLDLGRCIACGGCVAACPTGTIRENRSTKVAVRERRDLILSTEPAGEPNLHRSENSGHPPSPPHLTPLVTPLARSIHLREVSTGDNASDLEIAAANNPIFDSSRFGIHFVASPRFADALIVTGPVGKAMQEPLRRCFEAMAEPKLVIAAGAAAISGGLHGGGYADANGVDPIIPVSVYIPGNPPHPWYILHGILLAMGRVSPVCGEPGTS